MEEQIQSNSEPTTLVNPTDIVVDTSVNSVSDHPCGEIARLTAQDISSPTDSVESLILASGDIGLKSSIKRNNINRKRHRPLILSSSFKKDLNIFTSSDQKALILSMENNSENSLNSPSSSSSSLHEIPQSTSDNDQSMNEDLSKSGTLANVNNSSSYIQSSITPNTSLSRKTSDDELRLKRQTSDVLSDASQEDSNNNDNDINDSSIINDTTVNSLQASPIIKKEEKDNNNNDKINEKLYIPQITQIPDNFIDDDNIFLRTIDPKPAKPPSYHSANPNSSIRYPVFDIAPTQDIDSKPPTYTPTVYNVTLCSLQLEYLTPYQPYENKSWKNYIVEINSTQINFYSIDEKLTKSIRHYYEGEDSSNPVNSLLKPINPQGNRKASKSISSSTSRVRDRSQSTTSINSNRSSNATRSRASSVTSVRSKKEHYQFTESDNERILKTIKLNPKKYLSNDRLMKSYSLQHARIGITPDMKRTIFSLRMRCELEQFTIILSTVDDMINWATYINMGIAVSLDLEERIIPKNKVIPGRSRRRIYEIEPEETPSTPRTNDNYLTATSTNDTELTPVSRNTSQIDLPTSRITSASRSSSAIDINGNNTRSRSSSINNNRMHSYLDQQAQLDSIASSSRRVASTTNASPINTTTTFSSKIRNLFGATPTFSTTPATPFKSSPSKNPNPEQNFHPFSYNELNSVIEEEESSYSSSHYGMLQPPKFPSGRNRSSSLPSQPKKTRQRKVSHGALTLTSNNTAMFLSKVYAGRNLSVDSNIADLTNGVATQNTSLSNINSLVPPKLFSNNSTSSLRIRSGSSSNVLNDFNNLSISNLSSMSSTDSFGEYSQDYEPSDHTTGLSNVSSRSVDTLTSVNNVSSITNADIANSSLRNEISLGESFEISETNNNIPESVSSIADTSERQSELFVTPQVVLPRSPLPSINQNRTSVYEDEGLDDTDEEDYVYTEREQTNTGDDESENDYKWNPPSKEVSRKRYIQDSLRCLRSIPPEHKWVGRRVCKVVPPPHFETVNTSIPCGLGFFTNTNVDGKGNKIDHDKTTRNHYVRAYIVGPSGLLRPTSKFAKTLNKH